MSEETGSNTMPMLHRSNVVRRGLSLSVFILFALFSAGAVRADTITFDPLVSLNGTGFGTRLTILSLQKSPTEIGATNFVSPVGTGDSTNQDSALSIAQLQSLGITGINNFGLIYNLNQTGSGPNPTLMNLVVTFYNANGSVNTTFTLTGAFTASAVDLGNGGAGYPAVFSTTASESAAIAALFASCPTCLVGASATINGSNAGADSFFVYNAQVAAVPEPASILLLATALIGGVGYARRRFMA